MDENLIAPCGMDCSHCSHYLRYLRNEKVSCAGCRATKKKCAFIKGRCSKLQNGEVTYCFECKDFPCEQLLKIQKRYERKGWPNDFIGNLKYIEKNGPKKFLARQNKRFRCPKCQETVAIHDDRCLGCGYNLRHG